MIKNQTCICAPHIYDTEELQQKITEHTQEACNQWIYNLETNDNEYIVFQNESYILAHDQRDGRLCHKSFLIVYRDRRLRTLRDLRQSDAHMLLESYNRVLNYVQDRFSSLDRDWNVYFNYFPSVFQLHAHVNISHGKIHMRAHNLIRIVKNLFKDSNYYRDALILTRISKTNPVWESYTKTTPSYELESEIPMQSTPEKPLPMSKLTLRDDDDVESCPDNLEQHNGMARHRLT